MDVANLPVSHRNVELVAAKFLDSILVEIGRLIQKHIADQTVLELVETLLGYSLETLDIELL